MAKAKKPLEDGAPARRNWAGAVATDAANVGQTAFVRAGFADPSLVVHWEEIAGPEVARLARPLRLSEGPHGGVLTLLAEPGAAVFLQHETRSLCERINTYLGRGAVTRLKFVQGALTQRLPPPPCRKPAPDLTPDDPARGYDGPEGLREALWRLARARHSRS
jgi:hypothetical protein